LAVDLTQQADTEAFLIWRAKVARFKKLRKTLKRRIDIPMPFLKGKLGNWLKKDTSFTPKYFRDSFRELQKVTWPNRKETWRLFVAVTVFVFVLAAIIALADTFFEFVIERTII